MTTESPLLHRGLPAIGAPMLNIGRERTAIRAMELLRSIGANPQPTHRLPNGLGFIAPDTGRVHGPHDALVQRDPMTGAVVRYIVIPREGPAFYVEATR